jgi:hypothetical protein
MAAISPYCGFEILAVRRRKEVANVEDGITQLSAKSLLLAFPWLVWELLRWTSKRAAASVPFASRHGSLPKPYFDAGPFV